MSFYYVEYGQRIIIFNYLLNYDLTNSDFFNDLQTLFGTLNKIGKMNLMVQLEWVKFVWVKGHYIDHNMFVIMKLITDLTNYDYIQI